MDGPTLRYIWIEVTRLNRVSKRNECRACVEKIWRGDGKDIMGGVIYFIIYLYKFSKTKEKKEMWGYLVTKRHEKYLQIKDTRVILLNFLEDNTGGNEEKNRRQLLLNYLVMSLPLEHLCKHILRKYLFVY